MQVKWALVTGGSRGIGKGICIELAKKGCNVIVNYLSDEKQAADTVSRVKALGAEAYKLQADVSKRKEVDEMVEDISSRDGLDILVNNAAVVKFEPFLEITRDSWEFQMEINLAGAFNVGQEVARHMVEKKIKGKIVFISSFNQEVPNHSMAAYCITKSGIRMLAKSMALELSEHNINVNLVASGPVLTDINKPQVKQFPGLKERIEKIAPLQRWGTVEDIAKAAVFLASPDSDYVTGSTIFVEGGIMINNGMFVNKSI